MTTGPVAQTAVECADAAAHSLVAFEIINTLSREYEKPPPRLREPASVTLGRDLLQKSAETELARFRQVLAKDQRAKDEAFLEEQYDRISALPQVESIESGAVPVTVATRDISRHGSRQSDRYGISIYHKGNTPGVRILGQSRDTLQTAAYEDGKIDENGRIVSPEVRLLCVELIAQLRFDKLISMITRYLESGDET